MKRITIADIEPLITEYNGNIAAVARRLGCSRALIHKHANKSATLKDAISDARETMLDNVESALYKQVLEGNTTAMIFWLKTQGKQRGWVERQEVANINVSELTDDQLEAIANS